MTAIAEQPKKRSPKRKVLTDKMVADLPRKATTYFHPDPEMGRFGVRVKPHGPPHAYTVIARDPYGKQRWFKVGDTGAALPIAEAREQARVVIERIKKGEPPKEEPPVKKDTVADVCDNYLRLHVTLKQVISAPDIKRMIAGYILPTWGDRVFTELGRTDMTKLLDRIELVGLGKKRRGAKNGPRSRQADQVRGLLVTIGKWHQKRIDNYTCPWIGMDQRVPKDDRKRTHQLEDDELRAVWKACETLGVDGALFRILLLSGQRREKVVQMTWSSIAADGTWTIPRLSPREKGTAEKLKLPRQALAIMAKLPRYAGNDYVFIRNGRSKTKNIAAAKAALDEASGVTSWITHDLRRNCRGLLKLARVDTETAELVLGHTLIKSNVQKNYDVGPSDYAAMGRAIQAAADMLDRILAGESSEVIRGETAKVIAFPTMAVQAS